MTLDIEAKFESIIILTNLFLFYETMISICMIY